MLWKEVKSWAKNNGYETLKDKEDNQYYWAKLDSKEPDASGVAKSVSKLALAIYNHITDNKWVEHQQKYISNLEIKKVDTSDYSEK
jgi:hypothetical protein